MDPKYEAPAVRRTAEEIAREMVTGVDLEERYGWFATLNDDGNDRALMCMTGVVVDDIEIDRCVAKEDAVRWLSRLIEQSRAEGAAAALAAQRPNHNPAVCQAALDSIRCEPDGDMRLAVELGYQASVEPRGPRREVMQLASDRLRALAQTRDLAGCIRALVVEYAGRASDALIVEGADSYLAELLVIELNHARYEVAKRGTISQRWWDEMRSDRIEGPEWTAACRALADEVAAIVRECEEKR